MRLSSVLLHFNLFWAFRNSLLRLVCLQLLYHASLDELLADQLNQSSLILLVTSSFLLLLGGFRKHVCDLSVITQAQLVQRDVLLSGTSVACKELCIDLKRLLLLFPFVRWMFRHGSCRVIIQKKAIKLLWILQRTHLNLLTLNLVYCLIADSLTLNFAY